MGVARDDIDDADSLIRSAMLVFFVDQAELKLPTRTAFVRLIKAAKQPKAKLNENRLNAFLKEAPTEFQQLARRAMERFIETDLPQIRAHPAPRTNCCMATLANLFRQRKPGRRRQRI